MQNHPPTWADRRAALTASLAAAGVPEPELDATLLMGHVAGRPRSVVVLSGPKPWPPALEAALAPLAGRRAAREPLPYILGQQEFYGLALRCTPQALIPRWDTELLVDRALALCGDLPAPHIAEIGTGSGAIALALAAHLPSATIWATDAAPAALDLARANATALGLAARVTFAPGDLAAPLAGLPPFDLLVANLPYIPTAQLADLQAEVRDYEPRDALDGGADGLDLLRALAAAAPAHLRPGGALLLEHADDQGPAVRALLAEAGFARPTTFLDLGGRPRASEGYRR